MGVILVYNSVQFRGNQEGFYLEPHSYFSIFASARYSKPVPLCLPIIGNITIIFVIIACLDLRNCSDQLVS